MGDAWAFSIPASSRPSPSTTLPSVIQDAVWDKQLPQKLPDVSVGPVLGNDNQSLELSSAIPTMGILGRGHPRYFCSHSFEEGLVSGSRVHLALCGLSRETENVLTLCLIPFPGIYPCGINSTQMVRAVFKSRAFGHGRSV